MRMSAVLQFVRLPPSMRPDRLTARPRARQSGAVKLHEGSARATRVAKLFPEEGMVFSKRLMDVRIYFTTAQ